jgi:putative ABC transport system permease protein
MNDLKFAFRQLFKNPGFTVIAVLTLALGIGATTALFSVVYGVLISPYPYAKPAEIWAPGVRTTDSNQRLRPYRPDEFREMAKLPVFADVMATGPARALLTGEFAPETISGIRVSGNAFQFLGVPPLFGRTVQPTDIQPSGEPESVTVLSFKRWQKLFGTDTNILGKTLRLDDQTYTIVGVMPPRFGWWTDDGVWLPMGVDSRDGRRVFPIARLKQGVSASAAREQLHALQLELAKINPAGFPKEEFKSILTNYLDMTQASGTMQHSIQLLFGAVGFLLLIACANVANLQLAKATSRAREMAIRLSIGAGRAQLIRQLLTESVLLSVLGGLLGLLFAVWITELITRLIPGGNIPNESRIEINTYVLSFSVLISVVTGILFGLAPALQSSRPSLVNSLKDQSSGSGTSAGGRTRAALVVIEVASSMVLLVSAGLTARSFLAMQQVELGFRPERVMVMDLPLPPKRYPSWEQRNQFARELLEHVQALPGVEAATVGNGGLPFDTRQLNYVIEGHDDSQQRDMTVNLVAADYLRTMRIRLKRGRMVSEREVNTSQPLGVINETAAKLWPAGEDPIGRRLRIDQLGQPPGAQVRIPTNASPFITIVGVVGDTLDTQDGNLQTKPGPGVLLPYTLLRPVGFSLAVRTTGEPKLLANAIRAQVREMDKEQPVNGPTTFGEILNSVTAQPRFTMALFALFASLGLALAMAGIYSVLSYSVSKRTREIGVRVALGAKRGDVLRLILKSGIALVGFGIVLGLLASLAAARLLTSQIGLYQVNSTDPISFLGVIALLVLVAAVACFVPARRAAQVDPMEALRYE